MSISNRKLMNGSYQVKYESKLKTFIGKIYCLFKKHKKVTIETEANNVIYKYCICCWRKLD